MTSKIETSLLLSSYQQERKTGSSALGKDDFLRILMAQLQNQDPLNPMEDKEFIAQMASFTSLEQMTNMNKTIESFANYFIGSQSQDQLLKYSHMIGKEIEWNYTLTGEDGKEVTKTGTGIVSSVSQKGTAIELQLKDGTKIYSDEIVKISTADSLS